MKKLGILGGMGPESTLLYYKEIATRFKERDKKGYFPALTIEVVNMYEMLEYCYAEEYDLLADYLLKGIYNLEKSGVDFIILASNTPHVVFDSIKEKAHVPLLSITEPTYQALQSKGIKKACWLGIEFTMEQPYFRKRFIENNIEIVIPSLEERKLIDHVIATELEFGIINMISKKSIDSIINRLIHEENIEAIIMGCTELPLMYANEELPVPIFDTVQYHINGIIDYMFEE